MTKPVTVGAPILMTYLNFSGDFSELFKDPMLTTDQKIHISDSMFNRTDAIVFAINYVLDSFPNELSYATDVNSFLNTIIQFEDLIIPEDWIPSIYQFSDYCDDLLRSCTGSMKSLIHCASLIIDLIKSDNFPEIFKYLSEIVARIEYADHLRSDEFSYDEFILNVGVIRTE